MYKAAKAAGLTEVEARKEAEPLGKGGAHCKLNHEDMETMVQATLAHLAPPSG